MVICIFFVAVYDLKVFPGKSQNGSHQNADVEMEVE